METKIEVRGLKEIIARFGKLPQKVQQALRVNMEASLHTLTENVPPYPEKSDSSTYRRTGTLGRTLGSSMEGGASGEKPSIFEVKSLGSGVAGRWGTKTEYAPYVIGETEQAWMHKGRWWTVKVVAEKAKEKIVRIWNNVGDALARFLEKGT